MYWSASESQWYAEPKRLELLGLLRSRKEPGRTRARTHYELTDAGRDALRAWAVTPAGFPRLQNEAILRVLAADLVGDARALEGLRGLHAELDELDAAIDAAEEEARRLPHRERYLLLNHRLARRMVDAHRARLAEAERELGAGGAAGLGAYRARHERGDRVGGPAGDAAARRAPHRPAAAGARCEHAVHAVGRAPVLAL